MIGGRSLLRPGVTRRSVFCPTPPRVPAFCEYALSIFCALPRGLILGEEMRTQETASAGTADQNTPQNRSRSKAESGKTPTFGVGSPRWAEVAENSVVAEISPAGICGGVAKN